LVGHTGRASTCGWLLAAAIALICIGAPALACVGDCNGDGMVSVAELVEGVRISLGEAPLSECPAFDATPDGQLRIDELVLAVTAALDGCPATPTPSPADTPIASPTTTDTPEATGTPTPADTPTATPTVPMVAGNWREDPLAVTSSTCNEALTQQFADELSGRAPCHQTVEALSEAAIALHDCTGTVIDGTLDRDGTIHVAYPTTAQTVDGCTVSLTVSAAIPAAVSPTTATYTFAVAFSGTCQVADCSIEAQGAWTRE
jgi:hypothetical protein